jgi:hypothetical protein
MTSKQKYEQAQQRKTRVPAWKAERRTARGFKQAQRVAGGAL